MKVKALALLALSNTVETTKIDSDVIKESLNKVDKGTLLRNARVLRDKQYSNQNYQSSYKSFSGIDVDSSLLIEFEECTSLTILNDQVMAGMEKGSSFEASKDFIIFSAGNNNKHAKKKFAIDIPTFVSSMAETILIENYDFCQACSEAQGYCSLRHFGGSKNPYYSSSQQQNPYRQPENYGNQQNDYSAQERYDMYRHYNNGGGQSYNNSQSLSYKNYRQQYGNYRMNGGNRNLQQGRVTEEIDCGTCESVCTEQSNSYFQNSNSYNNNQGEYTNYEAIEWLKGLSECEEVNYGNYYNINGQNGSGGKQKQTYNQIYSELYAGLMCNADGTGIEIGLFMDEKCSVWNPWKSFKSILDEGTLPYFYYTKTKNLVEFIFTKQIGCGEIEYIIPYDNEGYYKNNYGNDNGYYAKENNGYDYSAYGDAQANIGCQYLFEGSILDIGGSCGRTNADDDGAFGTGQDWNAEESSIYTYFSSAGWSTYKYEITDQDSDDQLCTAIQKQVKNGATHTACTQSKKDNLYTYTKATSFFEKSKLNGADIFLIIVSIILTIALISFLRKKYISQHQAKKEQLINHGREIS